MGIYAGGMSPDDVLEAVEEADCAIAVGPLITDLSTSMFTHKVNRGNGCEGNRGPPFCPHRLFPRRRHRGCRRAGGCLVRGTGPGDSRDDRVHLPRLLCLAGLLGFRLHRSSAVDPAQAPAGLHGRRPLSDDRDGTIDEREIGAQPHRDYPGQRGLRHLPLHWDGPFNNFPPCHYADIVKVIARDEGYTVATEDELAQALQAAKINHSSYPPLSWTSVSKNTTSPRGYERWPASSKRR